MHCVQCYVYHVRYLEIQTQTQLDFHFPKTGLNIA